uniref:Uncharacterized protein n=1 Tax=Periophthalmus magnuspinnatus TaxID=409849 RepID=A0A3B4B396_9GOBI
FFRLSRAGSRWQQSKQELPDFPHPKHHVDFYCFENPISTENNILTCLLSFTFVFDALSPLSLCTRHFAPPFQSTITLKLVHIASSLWSCSVLLCITLLYILITIFLTNSVKICNIFFKSRFSSQC